MAGSKEVRFVARGLIALALAGARAQAADVIVMDTIPVQPTNWSDSLSVQRFNPAAGILNRIEITMQIVSQGTIGLENLDAVASIPNANLATAIQLQPPGGGAPLLMGAASVSPMVPVLAAFDGTINFAGPSGFSSGLLNFGDSFMTTLLPANPTFAQFVGPMGNPGMAVLPAQATGSANGGGAGNIVLQFTSSAGVNLTVRYVVAPDCDMDGISDADEIAMGAADCDGNGVPDVCQIPPDCNGNGIVDVCEPDCDFDGIPDDCEIPPDCNANGVPDNCEPDCNDNDVPDACDIAMGTSMDKDTNGIPDECGLCVSYHRRRPGSLLLYPEFDNRMGMLTVLTVTNTSCATSGNPFLDNVDVEFVYIDKNGCDEFNRVETLTPCDTITVVTSAHNPEMEQGYVYLFARAFSQGPPVSYNRLIGQQLVFDGVEAFEYAVNAVSFRSPKPQLQDTDLNANGLRDLNDIEYEPAPDQILIPRFLGQCQPNAPMQRPVCVESELILINLTGGAAFLTTVDFVLYNDNEQPFSAEFSFNCWAKPSLLQISGAFGQNFLAGTFDDADEILGAPYLESGWMRINGAFADSFAISIPDPAIYAVLVERVGAYLVGDLPFEECSQKNGALLARNLLGNM